MTGDKNLLMDAPLSPSPLKHITYANKGKSKVLGLGKVAILKDRHMDKVMLVESLGFNLMSVSMLCDLDMVVVFGKYRCRCQNWRISGRGSRTVRLGRMVTGGREHDVLPRFGPS